MSQDPHKNTQQPNKEINFQLGFIDRFNKELNNLRESIWVYQKERENMHIHMRTSITTTKFVVEFYKHDHDDWSMILLIFEL